MLDIANNFLNSPFMQQFQERDKFMSSGVTEFDNRIEQKNDLMDGMKSSVSSTFSAFNLREDMKGYFLYFIFQDFFRKNLKKNIILIILLK